MANTVLKPVWAEAAFRVEPARFPQQVSYELAGGNVSVTLDERGAVLRRTLPSSGLPISFALPVRAFKGVAARAIDHGNGDMTVTLELHHDDPELCIPLLVAHDLSDIAADWRSWSDAFNIPMLMVEADGVAHPLEDHIGDVRREPAQPRRRAANAMKHRPRFLCRRKTGSLGVAMKIEGKEIIARS